MPGDYARIDHSLVKTGDTIVAPDEYGSRHVVLDEVYKFDRRYSRGSCTVGIACKRDGSTPFVWTGADTVEVEVKP